MDSQRQFNDQRNGRETPQDHSTPLHLNFGYNENRIGQDIGRAFPTTPSTFPQPMYPNQYGQRETWGTQQPATAYANAGYFMPNPYQAAQFPQPPNLAAPSTTRDPNGYNDGTNGLVHDFQHQNLGGNAMSRSDSPYGRQPSPAQRLRSPPNPALQNYGNHLTPQANGHTTMSTDDELPFKNPERYTDNVFKRTKLSTELVSAFFKENVQRARDRNQRAKELEQYLHDPTVPNVRKEQKRNQLRRSEAHYLRFLRTKEKVNNFQTIRVIGKGAFGEVRLVQHKTDGKIYALKSLVKSEMYKRDQLAHVRAERDILAESDSPWVVRLHTTFQDSSFLYMLMDFQPGGDLMTMLIKYEIFSEDITRFYMAELTLALEAVHKLGFIHRDIKPDNILLDRGGHIKLSDFGLSTGFQKEHDQSYYSQLMHGKPKTGRDNRQSIAFDQIQLTVSNRSQVNTWRKSRRQLAYSTVGTPDYIAPEIFMRCGYDQGCDWWSLGTIMFECLIGWPPFCGIDNDEVYQKIVNWRTTLHFPSEQPLKPEPKDFMQRMMCDANDRLGHQGGATEVKRHPFFRGVDWNGLRRIRAPFEPKLESNIDTQYFPDDIPQHDTSAAVRARDAVNEDPVEMSLPFIGYTFKRFDNFRNA